MAGETQRRDESRGAALVGAALPSDQHPEPAVAGAALKATVIVGVTALCIAAMLALGMGFGREVWLTRAFGVTLFGSDVYLGTWFLFMCMPVVGFGVPCLVIRRVFREKLEDYGLTLGDSRPGVVALLAAVPALVTLPLISSAIGTEHYYDYLLLPSFVVPWKIAFHLTSYAAFIFGYEFLIRGFLLIGLARAWGGDRRARLAALAVSAVLAPLIFIGTPPLVFVLSFAIFAWIGGPLALRTRSIMYFAFIEWTLGIWSDAWEIIKLNARFPG